MTIEGFYFSGMQLILILVFAFLGGVIAALTYILGGRKPAPKDAFFEQMKGRTNRPPAWNVEAPKEVDARAAFRAAYHKGYQQCLNDRRPAFDAGFAQGRNSKGHSDLCAGVRHQEAFKKGYDKGLADGNKHAEKIRHAAAEMEFRRGCLSTILSVKKASCFKDVSPKWFDEIIALNQTYFDRAVADWITARECGVVGTGGTGCPGGVFCGGGKP